MRRIVVVRSGGLGDTILWLPALDALRRRHPRALIQLVADPRFGRLAGGIVDETISVHRSLFAGLYGVPSVELDAWLAGVDLLVSWTSSPAAVGVHQIHQSPTPPAGVHAADWLLSSIEPVPVDRPATPRLEAPPGEPLPPDAVFLHPGAGASWKRWPAPHFAQVAARLREQGRQPMLIEGPADEGAVAQIESLIRLPVIRREVGELAGLIAQAPLLVGNDSGVTHLAAALDIPTVALFGPTDPARWAPRGR
ncbi:MAG: glycosyltransferase family 9 protein, partial [Chloroflexota bacterium]